MAATMEETIKRQELDEDGYLQDINSWDIHVAEYLAGREEVELTAKLEAYYSNQALL